MHQLCPVRTTASCVVLVFGIELKTKTSLSAIFREQHTRSHLRQVELSPANVEMREVQIGLLELFRHLHSVRHLSDALQGIPSLHGVSGKRLEGFKVQHVRRTDPGIFEPRRGRFGVALTKALHTAVGSNDREKPNNAIV